MQHLLTACVLLALTARISVAKVHEAKCEVDASHSALTQQVAGTIRLRQVDAGSVTIGVKLTGLNTTDTSLKHGFHVHMNGDVSKRCANVGGHFNPAKQNHGGPNDTVRHAGDLGNLAEEDGELNVILEDSIISLTDMTDRHNIIGKTLVLHANEDDLGKGGQPDSLTTGNSGPKIACCIIVAAEASDFNFATCKMEGIGADINQQITGQITIQQLTSGGMTTYDGVLMGFNVTDNLNKHGFHVHEKGSTDNKCAGAMGHYNPKNVKHGAQTNTLKARHVGDLGNILEMNGKVDVHINDLGSGLKGSHSITARALVVHAGEDDLGLQNTPASRETGDSGARLGCCVIRPAISSSSSVVTAHPAVVAVVSLLLAISSLLC